MSSQSSPTTTDRKIPPIDPGDPIHQTIQMDNNALNQATNGSKPIKGNGQHQPNQPTEEILEKWAIEDQRIDVDKMVPNSDKDSWPSTATTKYTKNNKGNNSSTADGPESMKDNSLQYDKSKITTEMDSTHMNDNHEATSGGKYHVHFDKTYTFVSKHNKRVAFRIPNSCSFF